MQRVLFSRDFKLQLTRARKIANSLHEASSHLCADRKVSIGFEKCSQLQLANTLITLIKRLENGNLSLSEIHIKL